MSEFFAMLTEKSANLTGTGGGIPSITPEMVAAACCGLPRQKYLFGLARFSHSLDVLDELTWLNRQSVACRGEHESWVRPAKKSEPTSLEQIRWGQLADEALEFVLKEHHCSYCGGAGVQRNQKDCRVCRGSGKSERAVPSDRRMARALNVSRHEWRTVWSSRFAAVVNDYSAWEGDIDKAIRRQIFSEGSNFAKIVDATNFTK